MRIELRHFRYFVALAEELNFGCAAQKVYLTQPALSQQIQRLESELGFVLFERNKRKVELTEPGRAFLRVARRTLTTFERGMAEVKKIAGAGVERLRIGLTDYGNYSAVADVLRDFKNAYPEIELLEQEANTQAQIRALLERQLDVGLFMATTRTSALAMETLVVKDLYLAMPKDHPLSNHVVVSFAQLRDESLLVSARSLSPGYYDLIENCCKIAGIEPKLIINNGPQIHSFSTVARMISAGEGMMIMMDWFAQAEHPNLVFRPLIDPVPKLEFVVAYRPDEPFEMVHRFVEMLRVAFQI